MIHVVELPEGGEPHAWFAHDVQDLARKVAATDALQPWEIHDVLTPRELLAAHGTGRPAKPPARRCRPCAAWATRRAGTRSSTAPTTCWAAACCSPSR